jgi:hypothetical protein
MNNSTRKHPRTMAEAFGPYTSHHISTPNENRRKDRIAVAGSVVAAIFLVAGMLAGWF